MSEQVLTLSDLPGRLSNLCILSAPSGSGKTTLVKRLLEELDFLRFSISTTTRKPRTGEQEGVDYYFITREEFEYQAEKGAFLEHAVVHGNMYGTSISEVYRITMPGLVGILDIDIQGFRQIKKQFDEVTTVFIAPPNLDELRRRLLSRGTDDPESIELRLRQAQIEMAFRTDFDTVIINENIDEAYATLKRLLISMKESAQES
jgi:guanylate kinase